MLKEIEQDATLYIIMYSVCVCVRLKEVSMEMCQTIHIRYLWVMGVWMICFLLYTFLQIPSFL